MHGQQPGSDQAFTQFVAERGEQRGIPAQAHERRRGVFGEGPEEHPEEHPRGFDTPATPV